MTKCIQILLSVLKGLWVFVLGVQMLNISCGGGGGEGNEASGSDVKVEEVTINDLNEVAKKMGKTVDELRKMMADLKTQLMKEGIPDATKEMIKISWRAYKGDVAQLISKIGGMEGIKTLWPAAKAQYPWDQIEAEVLKFKKAHGLVDEKGNETGKESLSSSEEKEWDILIEEKIQPLVSRKEAFKGSELTAWLTGCGLKPMDITALPIPEEFKKNETYEEVMKKLGAVYVFYEAGYQNYTVLNIKGEEVIWEMLSKVVYEEGEMQGKVFVDAQRPKVSFFNYLDVMVGEKRCPQE